MAKSTSKDELELLANEARETFDLGDFLRKRSQRTKKVRVFTDEELGYRRGGFETVRRDVGNGLSVPDTRAWGLVKEVSDARIEYDALESKKTKEAVALKKKIDALQAEVKSLTAQLFESSLEIELRSIPPIVRKDAWRAAKRALGVKGKPSESEMEDLVDEHAAQLLNRTVVTIKNEATGAVNEGVTLESARHLRNFLPDSEWAKIDSGLAELLFEKSISDQVVSDTDF